ncbi:biogenesis of lysosome-related organelles complex 1 subunit 6 isoform X3 [Drosophila suzukii]|uniref:Biogenesis of lysosome-related organelles complex 1 subunit 6 isoform X3 n=1 Tax=Drosophila suzukii TaxID=28584 RepID=A0ABM4TRP9_DROSZ
MLKSSNINSVLNELPDQTARDQKVQSSNNGNPKQDADTCCSSKDQDVMGSLAALQLSAGVLQIAEPPLEHVRSQLRELIGRQNKIYIDVSKEKYKLDCSEVARLNDMKRAANVAACKQRDYQRKLERLQHEESLIGGH